MKARSFIVSLSLLIAGGGTSPACWTFALDPQGTSATQMSRATIYTPFNVSHGGGPGLYFEMLGFYDAAGTGLTRDVVVGIVNNLYGAASVTIPAGPTTKAWDGFRWAYLDQPFFLDPDGMNYLFYEGEFGDEVRLASRFEVNIHPLFELGGNGYRANFLGGPAFMAPPDSGLYVFGANAHTTPEPSQYAMMLVMLLGGGVIAWWRHRRGLSN